MLQDGSTMRQAASYTYDEDGSLVSGKSDEADLQTEYLYNYAGDLTELTNQTSAAGSISRYTSAYRLNGQKISGQSAWNTRDGKTKNEEAVYTYDEMGRLLTENHTGEEKATYTYDSHGNRKTMTQGNQKISYTYNKKDELLRTDCLDVKNRQNAVTLYKYDPNGNQLSCVLTGNNKVSCQYDTDGYRISKTVNGKTTYFIWDDDQIVMELDAKGNVKKRYIRGNSLISTDDGEGTESVYYVLNDHGDVVQLLDKSGDVIREYTYDSFGNELNADKKDDNPFRYAGEYFDRETGNIYLRSRYYAPEQGRFLTMDTYTGEDDDPLSLHRYAYCDNDGVNQVDPDGNWGRKKGFGYKGDKFVHKSITMRAWFSNLNQSFSNRYVPIENGKVVELVKSNMEIILDGAVLPDFVFEKKKQKKSKKQLTKKYGKKYYRKYKLYSEKKKLLEEKIWNYDKYNGKTNAGQKYFKNEGIIRFQGPFKKNQKYLYLGCVLHSIQDYQAHSYVSELKGYKEYLKQHKSRKKDQKLDEYHSDWKYDKKKQKIVQNKDLHRNNKDNPYMDFVYTRNSKYEWVKKPLNYNKRFIKAINNSEKHLKKILNYIK